MKLFYPLLFVLSLHSYRTSAGCYTPNGTDINLFPASGNYNGYLPCNAGDDVSMCCALNTSPVDKCRSDGLCLSWDSKIWRESCTDRTWKSPQCIKLCTQGTGFNIQGTDMIDRSGVDYIITQCRDGSYCCGNGSIGQACCDLRKGVFLLNGDIVPSNPSTTTSTAMASSATKSSSTASSSSAITSSSPPSLPLATSSSPLSPDKSPSGRKTGILVGAVLGTALIITIGSAIFLLKKSWRKRRQAVATDQALVAQVVRHPGKLYKDDRWKEPDERGNEAELDGRRHEVELDGGRHEVELDGRRLEVELGTG